MWPASAQGFGRASRAVRTALAALAAFACAAAGAHAAGPGKYGLGRAPTPAEVRSWDIDVRPDFAGLPRGSGSVERGQDIWDARCASCHGVFGESNEVFNPIIGGTTPDEATKGNVKSLTTSELQRTTMMKLSSLATIWDYIRRAMPWNAPKSLSDDEVYAVTAYILHLADLVPAGFVLSDANIRATERLLPNRNGMTRDHGMWDVRGKPDVRNGACLRDCAPAAKIESAIPDHARNAHGNLAEQSRPLGGLRGVDTTRPAPGALAATAAPTTGSAVTPAAATASGAAGTLAAATAAGAAGTPAAPTAAPALPTPAGAAGAPHPMLAVATRQGCLACHGIDRKIVGPGLKDIAARHAKNADGATLLAERIRAGGSGQWGTIPMPPQSQVSPSEVSALAAWIAIGAPSSQSVKRP